MPNAHRIALKKLLKHVDQRIARDEVQLLAVTGDYERGNLIQELADLHVRQGELISALGSDGDSS
jgi:hypothetical protein